MSILNNTASLEALLEQVNSLPEADTNLPELSNEGSAGDLLAGKQLINSDGEVVTGNIPTKTSNDLEIEGPEVIVPSGYYPSPATKFVPTVPLSTPTISINSSGKITASVVQDEAGYIDSGDNSTTTKQLTTQAAKTITPSTSSQTAVAKNVYTTGAVTVNPIPSNYVDVSGVTASTADVLSGKTFGANGSVKTGTVQTFDGSYECSGDSTGGSSGDANIGTCTLIVRNTYNNKTIAMLAATVFSDNSITPYAYVAENNGSVSEITVENVLCGSVVVSSPANISIIGIRVTNVERITQNGAYYMLKITAQDGETAIIEFYNND